MICLLKANLTRIWKKICAVSLARFRSEDFRAEAISLGARRVYDLLAMINDGYENQMKLRFMREIFSKMPLEEFHRKINALNKIGERYDLYATETGIKQRLRSLSKIPKEL